MTFESKNGIYLMYEEYVSFPQFDMIERKDNVTECINELKGYFFYMSSNTLGKIYILKF